VDLDGDMGLRMAALQFDQACTPRMVKFGPTGTGLGKSAVASLIVAHSCALNIGACRQLGVVLAYLPVRGETGSLGCV